MDYNQIKNIIKKSKIPVLLIGDPGIGKSTVVKDVAKEIADEMGRRFVEWTEDKYIDPEKDFIFVDVRLSTVEPADLVGIPKFSDESFSYVPPKWVYDLTRCPGMLFLDEINATNRDDVISAAFQLILDRKAGFREFHPDVKVVAAGNDPKSNAVARPLPSPLINRFITIKMYPPKVEDWIEYMTKKHGDNWNKHVAGFLTKTPSRFIRVESAETLSAFPTPRTWEWLATHVGEEVDEAMIIGLIGEQVGREFIAYLRLADKIDIDKIKENPKKITTLDIDLMIFALTCLSEMKDIDPEKVAEMIIELAKTRFDLVVYFLKIADKTVAHKYTLLACKKSREFEQKMSEILGQVI